MVVGRMATSAVPSTKITLTDLPPEVLGPLLLRALPLAPACSPDLIARPCRAALAHLSAQQVAQWLLEVRGGGNPHTAMQSLAGFARSDREAVAELMLDACSDDADTLHACLKAAASQEAMWLFQFILQRLRTSHPSSWEDAALSAATHAPEPASKLAFLHSLPAHLLLSCPLRLNLFGVAREAAKQGDGDACCGLLRLCPMYQRGSETLTCMATSAINGHPGALPTIASALPVGTQLSEVDLDWVARFVVNFKSQVGLQECKELLLEPLAHNLSHESAAQLVQLVVSNPGLAVDQEAVSSLLRLVRPGYGLRGAVVGAWAGMNMMTGFAVWGVLTLAVVGLAVVVAHAAH